MDIKDKALRVVAKNVNLSGLVVDLLEDVVEDALQNLVERTDTEFDDIAKAALYPVLSKELKELAEDKLDLEKILGLNEVSSEVEA